MISHVKKAEYVENEYIRVSLIHVVPFKGKINKVDYIYSKPVGDWKTLEFCRGDEIVYHKFLDNFVFNNIDVIRKKCIQVADIANYQKKYDSIVKNIRIIDNTFIPPGINPVCMWQNDMVRLISKCFTFRVINTCYNSNRLNRFYDRMNIIIR